MYLSNLFKFVNLFVSVYICAYILAATECTQKHVCCFLTELFDSFVSVLLLYSFHKLQAASSGDALAALAAVSGAKLLIA